MKIYTKTGDQGKTSLYGGTRVPKNHIRIEAYGTIDELNSQLGLLNYSIQIQPLNQKILIIQNDLFILGSELATPNEKLFLANGKSRLGQLIQPLQIDELELWIDEMENELQPLNNFILPGGTKASALAHVCRTICRRAERIIVALNEFEEIRPVTITYLNRLSDYFFVLARYLNTLSKVEEIKWNPNE